MEGELTADEFYKKMSEKSRNLLSNPIVPHKSFAEYLKAGRKDVSFGYGVLAFLDKQGKDSGFEKVYSESIKQLKDLLGDEVGPIDEETHFLEKDIWHTNIFELTVPTKWQKIDESAVKKLEALCGEIIDGAHAFSVEYNGIVGTMFDGVSAILICGYAERILAEIRNRFFTKLSTYPRELKISRDLIPGVYQAQKNSGTSAPITAVRLQGQLRNSKEYVRRLFKIRNVSLGRVTIKRIEFVYHGANNHPSQKRVIKSFELPT